MSDKNKQYKFKFSIIMSIYDTEQWLREAVDSLINQNIGFEKNVQIVFVNDGSPDNSEAICLEYRDKYPDNIKYVKKENGGLASARNVGLKHVRGEFVNFFDPDDILSKDTLGAVDSFFRRHYSEIDLVAIKLILFEAREGNHGLNYKFDKDAIIDLEEQYDFAQLSAASAFIKTSAISGIRFDDSIRYSEDVMFIPQILCQKMKYGVLSKPTYYYRQRYSSSSITDNKSKNDYWFTIALPQVHFYLVNFSIDKYGQVLKFIQYIILYHIAGEIMGKLDTRILSEKQLKQYKLTLRELVCKIDDDVIMKERQLTRTHKIYLLGLKNNENSLDKLVVDKEVLSYRSNPVYQLKWFNVNVEILRITDSEIELEGYNNGVDIKDIELCFSNNNKTYKAEAILDVPKPMYFVDELIYTKYRFRVKIPLAEDNNIRPFILANNKKYYVKFIFRKHTRLSDSANHAFRIIDRFAVLPEETSLVVRDKRLVKLVRRRLKRLKYLLKQRCFEAILIRLTAAALRPFLRKPIWIISDRLVCGRDNGEALFRYIATSNNENYANVYFTVNRTSSDFKRLKAYGKVINRQGLWYKILFLLSDKVISSHFDDFVTNPYGIKESHFSDMFKFDYVFLQHGVTKDDMAPLLNKYRRNIHLLITTARAEYDDFLSQRYGYDQSVVKLTGFPRFDLLVNDLQNKLIIAPTWRNHIITKAKPGTDLRLHDALFMSSDYYVFYNNLINDKKILSSLKNNNMTAEFFVHPNLSRQSQDFEGNLLVTVKTMPYDYTEAFKTGNILVTDYSSVAFDFAYLKKPVIYTQFDRNTFFASHYRPGYFDYKEDGFGPVLENYEDSVREIVDTIESKGALNQRYRERIEDFYYKFDQENSKRVYDEILNN